MNWSLTLKLMPGEEILDQPEDRSTLGIKTVHTPILTNRRALFRFNSLSSGLIQAFSYDEIEDARPANRLLIKYLRLTAGGKTYYLNVDVPEEWALKIHGYKEMQVTGRRPSPPAEAVSAPAGPSADELADMLDTLRTAGLLTEAEYAEKRARLKV